jgi:hypothetical protein
VLSRWQTTIDGVEAEIVDKAEHGCFGVRRIAGNRESNPSRRIRLSGPLEFAIET